MHTLFMNEALREARLASESNDIPVGAILVKDDKIISKGRNSRHSKNNPLGHAELMAIREASKILNTWRLEGTSLYVTLEPCLMCTGAIINSRIDKVIYGATDYRYGAFSLYSIDSNNLTNHHFETQSGVLEQECTELLQKFFKNLRKNGSLQEEL